MYNEHNLNNTSLNVFTRGFQWIQIYPGKVEFHNLANSHVYN